MKINIYSIFDTASGLYLRPLFAQSDGQAMRSFEDVATDADSEIGKHPEDYSMFRLGIFDDNNGFLTNEDSECLVTGLEAVAASRNVKRDNLELFDKKITKMDSDAEGQAPVSKEEIIDACSDALEDTIQ